MVIADSKGADQTADAQSDGSLSCLRKCQEFFC